MSSRTAIVPSCDGERSRSAVPAFANGVRQPSTMATRRPTQSPGMAPPVRLPAHAGRRRMLVRFRRIRKSRTPERGAPCRAQARPASCATMSQPVLRAAHHGEIRDLAILWTHAFPGVRTFAQRVQDLEDGGTYGGIDSSFVAHAGRELVGALRMYRMHEYIGGAALPMMGL